MSNSTDKSYSPYAPIRLKNQSFWYKYAISAGRQGLVTQNGMLVKNFPDQMLNELIHPAIAAMLNIGSEPINTGEAAPLISNLYGLRHWVPLVAQYNLCGEQIFDLGENLIEMFEHTDIKDANIKDLNMPYDALFLRFGKRDSIKLKWHFDNDDESIVHSWEYLDGAYVAITPLDDGPRLKIGFTMTFEDGKGVEQVGHFADFLPDELDIPLSEAIDHSLMRKIKEFEDDEVTDEFSKQINDCSIYSVKENYELMKNAISLVLNCLFYLEKFNSKEESKSPGRDCTPVLESNWNNAKASKNESKEFSASKKITKNGYAFVYMVGHDITIPGSDNSNSVRDGVSMHWRRGHQRNQHYGPKNTMTKRVWIKPTLIGKNGENESPPGHIYLHGKSDTKN